MGESISKKIGNRLHLGFEVHYSKKKGREKAFEPTNDWRADSKEEVVEHFRKIVEQNGSNGDVSHLTGGLTTKEFHTMHFDDYDAVYDPESKKLITDMTFGPSDHEANIQKITKDVGSLEDAKSIFHKVASHGIIDHPGKEMVGDLHEPIVVQNNQENVMHKIYTTDDGVSHETLKGKEKLNQLPDLTQLYSAGYYS